MILDIFLFRFFALKGETRVNEIRWKIYLSRVKPNSREINTRKMRVDYTRKKRGEIRLMQSLALNLKKDTLKYMKSVFMNSKRHSFSINRIST